MRHRRFYIGLALLSIIFFVYLQIGHDPILGIETGYAAMGKDAQWLPLVAELTNKQEHYAVYVNGQDAQYDSHNRMVLVAAPTQENTTPSLEQLDWYVSLEDMKELLQCYVGAVSQREIVLQRGDRKVLYDKKQGTCTVDGETPDSDTSLWVIKQDGQYYVSEQMIEKVFGFQLHKEQSSEILEFASIDPLYDRSYPESYDYRVENRMPLVRDQGDNGDCWAMASITALESSLTNSLSPVLSNLSLSVDHLLMNNSSIQGHDNGGRASISIGYFLAWQGPVLEEEDPYNDGVSDATIEEVAHVQEVRFIDAKDYDGIKETIFLYGGVQSSIYMSNSSSQYYNKSQSSYYYNGEEPINHEIVIVGWDDHYAKENFQIQPEEDGAFICVNSWGNQFGDEGCFYVSYFDTNIGIYNYAYTEVSALANYDNIYQTDLCGLIGQLGYRSDTAYFANHYQSERSEKLEAVGFYATGANTSYEVYVEKNVERYDSMSMNHLLAAGTLEYAGYYTIPLTEPVYLRRGEDFVIMVKITTPGSTEPIAIEYQPENDPYSDSVITTDGDGYISAWGKIWSSVEGTQNGNVCLKAYTTNE